MSTKKIVILVLFWGFFLLPFFIWIFWGGFLWKFVVSPYFSISQWAQQLQDAHTKEASELFQKAKNSLFQNFALYDDGVARYKSEDFSWALLDFSWSQNSLQSLHNLGNSLYYLGTKQNDTTQKVSLWKQSLSAYSWALTFGASWATQQNYDFVLKKLQELEKNQNKSNSGSTSKDQEKNQNSGSGSSDKNSSWSGSQDSKDSQQKKDDSKNQQNSSQGNTSQNSSSQQRDSQYQFKQWQGNGWLSQEEKNYIENYQQSLQDFQKRNAQFYNKKPSSSQGDDIFGNFVDPFTGEPVFQNSLNQTTKDW